MKLSILFIALLAVVSFSGCQKRAVAMNMYKPQQSTTTVSGVEVVVTKEMIEAVKKRRERYLKEHKVQ